MRSRWTGRVGAAVSAVALLAGCGGVEEGGGEELAQVEQAAVSSTTFGAVADARVEAAAPTTNFGSSRTLMADTSPQSQSYLRFDVTGVSGTVTRATVRLYVIDGTSDGPQLFLTAGGWSETGVTWNTRPAPTGAPLGDAGELSNGTWLEYDVTAAVKGNGELNFALVPTASNGTDVASRQADSPGQRPQLVVTTDTGSTPPPPPTTSGCGEALTQTLSVATGDATIAQDQPTTNFGNLGHLVADYVPLSELWLGFQIPANPGSGSARIVKATVRLYAFDGSPDGPALYAASRFDEASITWSNAWPGQRTVSPIDNKAAIAANTWVEYDVTKAVENQSTQEVFFTLASGHSDGTRFYSREWSDARLRPQLVVTYGSGCTYRGSGGALTGDRQYGAVGEEQLFDSATDRQGGLAVLGRGSGEYTFGGPVVAGAHDLVLARYDAAGAHLWTRAYHASNGASIVHPTALTVTPEGNLLVVGSYEGAPDLGLGALPAAAGGSRAMFVAKFAPDGRLVWNRGFLAHQQYAWGAEPSVVLARDVATDASGSLIVLAELYGITNVGGADVEGGRMSTENTPGLLLAKFRWDGEHLWSTGVAPGPCLTGVDGRALATDSAGRVLVGGRTCQTALGGSGPETPFVMRYSSEGTPQWVRTLSGVLGDVRDVAVGPGDTVHFAGNFSGRFTFAGRTVESFDPGEVYDDMRDAMVGTYRADGSEAWLRDSAGGGGFGVARRLAVDPAGRLAVVGTQLHAGADLGGGELAAGGFLVRYSAAGAHLWSRSFLADGARPEVVNVQPSGNVVASFNLHDPVFVDGRTFGMRGNIDLLLLQFAP